MRRKKDHCHGKGEQVEIGGLAGSLDITKKEGLQVSADDTKRFRQFEEAVPVQHHEGAKHQDTGQFDDSAPRHPVVQIVEKINSVTTDSQYDEGIQLPEFVPGGHAQGTV